MQIIRADLLREVIHEVNCCEEWFDVSSFTDLRSEILPLSLSIVLTLGQLDTFVSFDAPCQYLRSYPAARATRSRGRLLSGADSA